MAIITAVGLTDLYNQRTERMRGLLPFTSPGVSPEPQVLPIKVTLTPYMLLDGFLDKE